MAYADPSLRLSICRQGDEQKPLPPPAAATANTTSGASISWSARSFWVLTVGNPGFSPEVQNCWNWNQNILNDGGNMCSSYKFCFLRMQTMRGINKNTFLVKNQCILSYVIRSLFFMLKSSSSSRYNDK